MSKALKWGRPGRSLAFVAASSAGVAVLTACGAHSPSSGGVSDPSQFTYLSAAENTTVQTTLKSLAAGACKSEDAALPLSISTVPQANMDQKLSLLAGQDALPAAFQLPDPGTEALLAKADQVQDLAPTLAKAGLSGWIVPAAAQVLRTQFHTSSLFALPTELNIEGIWYNKKIFADNGITVPGTWDQLMADAAKLKAAGVQAFALDGKDGWPTSRLIGAYIYRSLGPDALQEVADGKAKLTDPGYVQAATAVADLAKAGYGGSHIGSIDYTTAQNEFVTGKAAMWYMGSWALSVFTDPKQTTIGTSNIGYMPFPAVTGGKGSIDQTPANVGIPLGFSSSSFGPKTQAWMECIVKNYGHQALADSGQITGFKVSPAVTGLSPLVKSTEKQIAATKQPVLWFEALFGPQETNISQTTTGELADGSLSPSAFMSGLQAANGS